MIHSPQSAPPPSASIWKRRITIFGFTKNPGFRRFLKWGSLLLFSFLVLFYNVELWIGKRAWAQVQKRAVAEAMPAQFLEAIPKKIADDQNFLASPIVKKMLELKFLFWFPEWDTPLYGQRSVLRLNQPTEWDLVARFLQRTKSGRLASVSFNVSPGTFSESKTPPEQLLEALASAQTTFDELKDAARRPEHRLDFAYEKGLLAKDIPYTGALVSWARAVSFRSEALLKTGRQAEALSDWQLALRMLEALPGPLMHMEHQASRLAPVVLQPIWEGLRNHQWSPSELDQIEQSLRKVDFITNLESRLRYQNLMLVDVYDLVMNRPLSQLTEAGEVPLSQRILFQGVRFLYPRGWYYQGKAALYRLHLDRTEWLREDPLAYQNQSKNMKQLNNFRDPFGRIFLFPKAEEIAAHLPIVSLFAQVCVDQGLIACALERFHLENKNYPETLQELSPRFITRLPRDPLTGSDYRYQRQADGSFLLYSVGSNLQDDQASTEGRDLFQLPKDWVWSYPRLEFRL